MIEGFIRFSARPQKVNFFAQVGSESPDDNLDNNVAHQSIVVSEYQQKNPLNVDFNQWIEDKLAALATKAMSKP